MKAWENMLNVFQTTIRSRDRSISKMECKVTNTTRLYDQAAKSESRYQKMFAEERETVRDLRARLVKVRKKSTEIHDRFARKDEEVEVLRQRERVTRERIVEAMALKNRYYAEAKELREQLEGSAKRLDQLHEVMEGMKEASILVESIVGEDSICCACMVTIADVRYDECGHLCICQECSVKLGDANPSCPLCRTEGPRTQVSIVWEKKINELGGSSTT
jgi:DNA repair exonuclease SbcCD ATPase subunit